MKHTNDATKAPATGAHASAGMRALQPWVRPRIVRVGSVAQVTAKVDNTGRNDGGIGQMKRT
ncbi:MAG: hypothetical protein WC700_11745 [Gemmatimonadaceae bacterium]|jgi:hypothetical protein